MVVGANSTDYLLDGQSMVREIKNGQVDATYLVGPRGPECKRDAQGVYEWYVFDGLGSVVATVNDAGTVVSSRAYDVYGAVRSGGGGTRHKFVGSLGHASDDETGLLYMRARYMDPATGRLLSEDSARHGMNWFAYCDGNPVSRGDPDGKRWYDLKEWEKITGVSGIAGAILLVLDAIRKMSASSAGAVAAKA